MRRFQGRSVQAVLIDLDGTLVDTLGDFDAALNRTLAELGLPGVDRAFIERTVGQGSEHLIRRTLAQATGDEVASASLYDAAWAAYQRHYLSLNGQHAQVYPGATEGVQHLAGLGLPLVCLTNKPGAFARPLLESKGLLRHFAHVFGGDAFERKKPHPLPLLKSCEALGSLPSATLMLGDSRNDAQAARAAGCPVVLVTYGYNHGEDVRQVDADAWIERIDALALD